METSEYPTPQVKKIPETKSDKPDFTAAAKGGDPTITGVPLPPEYQTPGSPYVDPNKLGPQKPVEFQWQDEIPPQPTFPSRPNIELVKPSSNEDHKDRGRVLRFPDGKVIE